MEKKLKKIKIPMYSDGNMKKNVRPLQRGPLGYLSHDVKKIACMPDACMPLNRL